MANSTGQDILLDDLGAGEAGPVNHLEVAEAEEDLVIFGDAGNNNITGTGGDNQVDAGAGFDIVRGGGGNDILIGGNGNDTLNGGVDEDVMIGNRDDDTLNGGAGDDILRGGGGQDVLRGHNGNDYLNGGGGADRLLAGRGADTLIGNVGDDFLNGGSGTDTAVFFGNINEYTIALSENGGSVTKTSGLGANEGVDTIRKVEILQFADQRVLVVGANGFDTIQEAVDIAQDGDIIRIAAGTYTEQVDISGKESLTLQGEGAGTVIRAPAALELAATGLPAPGGTVDAAGVVNVIGSRDIAILDLAIDGDDAGDAIVATSPAYFAGLLFVDSSGAAGNLTISGVREPLSGGLPSNTRTGDGIAIYNTDSLSRDVAVTGTTIFDFQKTGIRASGEDLAIELEGNTINGAGLLSAADALTQFGITVENGTGGRVAGNTISNIGTLRGDQPSVGVFIDEAADKVQVMENVFNGVGAPNTHTGIIVDGEVNDARIEGNAFNGLLNGIAAIDNVDGVKIDDNTFTGMLDEVATVTGGSRPGLNVALSGTDNDGAGRDAMVRFDGTDGADLVEGSSTKDVIRTLDGDDFLAGGDGDDRLIAGDGDDTVNGDDGDDTLVGNQGSDLLSGGLGEDTLRGGGGDDQLNGQDGADRLIGGGGSDLINGGEAGDWLQGGGGHDELNGGAGDDRLAGGGGNDVITGHDGLDVYVFDADHDGEDTVIGFEAGETIELAGFGFADEAAAEAAFTQVGADVFFSADGVEVTFENASRADVIADLLLDPDDAPAAAMIARAEAPGAPVGDDLPEDLFVSNDDDFTEIA